VIAPGRARRNRLGAGCALALALMACAWVGIPAALASAGGQTKIVRYHAYSVVVPAGWPVYNLADDPTACVRFNRDAVYLGRPGSEQDCPSHSVGRTEAILIEPLTTSSPGAAGTTAAIAPAAGLPAQGGQSSAGQLILSAHRVGVIATWHDRPSIVERALGRHSLPPAPAPTRPVAPAGAPSARVERRADAPAQLLGDAGGDPIYTGLGFDTCSAPSASQLAAWGSSPYRAVGIYIGGANLACSQPSLTGAWVAGEEAAGWHLIPIYAGLQAPGSSCGCAAIDPSQAMAEGATAATDAVNHARSLGIGTGNPIYFDMEAYTPGASTTSTVLAFLSGWTAQLHGDGYESGVYSSPASGISDLVAQYGTSYEEPDEIWFADWNGEQTTSAAYIPSGDWSNHQRLHQLSGGVNASYGGVTLNIDGDDLDGATAGSGEAAGASSEAPADLAPPSIAGDPSVGQTLAESHGTWSNDPTSYSHQWEDCNSTGTGCSPIRGATAVRHSVTASDIGHAIRVQETARNAQGTGGPATSAATGLVQGSSSIRRVTCTPTATLLRCPRSRPLTRSSASSPLPAEATGCIPRTATSTTATAPRGTARLSSAAWAVPRSPGWPARRTARATGWSIRRVTCTPTPTPFHCLPWLTRRRSEESSPNRRRGLDRVKGPEASLPRSRESFADSRPLLSSLLFSFSLDELSSAARPGQL